MDRVFETLAQLPLMFVGGFLIVLAVGIVWLFARARARKAPNG